MKTKRLTAHLDLKGLQYRPEYFAEYFRNLRELGYDSVLVEYEDVFPFVSATLSLRPQEVWSREFHQKFLKLAAEEGLEVIPLQQCLGHLEYAFRIPANRPFSVPGGDFRDLDATSPEAKTWLKNLLCEILEAHPGARHVHLGMDEAGGFVLHARAAGREPLDVFLEYLEELCEICAAHGKVPLIWSDMLEDHIRADTVDRLLALREKVVLVPWNYGAGIRPESVVRFSGLRCSCRWLENPGEGPGNATPIWDGLLSFEDWEPKIRELTADFQTSPYLMEPLFQAGVWKRLGFTVWGGAGGSITQDRSVLPFYHWRMANVRLWKEKVEQYDLDGLIITQWARSNSCSVPNIVPDVVWPVLARAASASGGRDVFFPEVESGFLDDLILQIGRCREDWSVEKTLIQVMEKIAVKKHVYEWNTLLWMLRILSVHKEIASAGELIGCYAGIGRLNGVAWNKQLDHLLSLRPRLCELRAGVKEHLGRRYFGGALEEWFYKVFDLSLEEIDRLEEKIRTSILSFQSREAGQPFPAL